MSSQHSTMTFAPLPFPGSSPISTTYCTTRALSAFPAMSCSINLPEANEITLFSGWARTDAAVADSATAHRGAQDNKLLLSSAQYRKCGLSAEWDKASDRGNAWLFTESRWSSRVRFPSGMLTWNIDSCKYAMRTMLGTKRD